MVVSDSTVPPPDTEAVTVTCRADTPSPIEVCAPFASGSASTDRSIVPESVIVNDAPLTVNPGAAPPTASASVSATTESVLVVSGNAPDFDPVPAAITTSKES